MDLKSWDTQQTCGDTSFMKKNFAKEASMSKVITKPVVNVGQETRIKETMKTVAKIINKKIESSPVEKPKVLVPDKIGPKAPIKKISLSQQIRAFIKQGKKTEEIEKLLPLAKKATIVWYVTRIKAGKY
jgi:hypothetical protein